MAIVATVVVVGAAGGCSSSRHSGAGTTSSASVAPSSTGPTSTSSGSTSSVSTVPPSTAPTTGGPFFPVSATFVSSQLGWALESTETFCETDACAYRVAATTDGGTTWRTVSATGLQLRNQPRIRFADATRGFVFDDTQIFATRDAGSHWTALSLPFQTVQTLEIVHDEVTVVAASFDRGDRAFRIWSTPADPVHWTRHALAVPIGAGPVPEQQLVLTGTRGWLINVDRTVVSGALRSGASDWTTWTPPCLQVLGPAELSASSSTDLVALCNEHVWGGPGPVASAVYFSHDGGATFRRRGAPVYGLFSSPNPTTAVVVDARSVWRTTDQGSTWRVVSRPGGTGGDAAVEIGFTTRTQGFLIEGRGGMFMTRDAGAHWSRAPLP